MKFVTGNEYYGFKFLNKEYLNEVNSDAYLLEHVETGARVFALKNDDHNKTFSIGFRTPATDSTGVPHILEHTVFCGSRKFRVKDVLTEMIKGSLQTFINAFTFPDKTMYPFSTRNKKDYFNLMDVYLDAVFYPLLDENMFKQEGWHYELDSKEDEIKYKGVVYNEMKGAFSSPQQVLYRYIQKTLYPNTAYGVESGGDPEDIPKLTYKAFKDYHSKYYHPSNSYIYFYGDAPLEEELKFIQDNYLNDFKLLEIDSHIDKQKTLEKPVHETVYYPVSEDDTDDEKSMMAISQTISEFDDKETIFASELLVEALYKNEASPLRKALIEKNISHDIMPVFEEELRQPFASIVLMNTDEKHWETFENTYNNTLKKIIGQGIEKDLLRAVLNEFEFSLREEKNAPLRGLWYSIRAFKFWLYDKSPIEALQVENIINTIKKKVDEGNYFEDILKKYFLENNHKSFIKLLPSKTLAKEKEKAVKTKLNNYKNSLSETQLNQLVVETKRLKDEQNAPNTKEGLKSLPKLSINDVSPDVEKIDSRIISKEKPFIMYHNLITNKIAYLGLYFDTKNLDADELGYLNILGKLMTNSGTKKSSYSDIAKKISTYTGGIDFKFKTVENVKTKASKNMFALRTKIIIDRYKKLCELLTELLSETTFEDYDRIKKLLKNEKSKMEQQLINRSHLFVIRRLSAYTSNSGKEDEIVNGVDYYSKIKKAIKEFDENPEKFVNKLKNIKSKILTKDNLYANLTVDIEHKDEAISVINDISKVLPQNSDSPTGKKDALRFNPNEALSSSSQVQYVGIGANIYEKGLNYSGSFEVLMNYLDNSYLWDKVRVLGGAYGCFTVFHKDTGSFSIVSYRDPNLKETYQVYEDLSKHLADLKLDEEDFSNLIISSANDPLLSPATKAKKAFIDYLTGFNYEDELRIKKEILKSKLDDVKSYSGFFKRLATEGYRCVYGGESKIKQHKDLFSKVINVIG